MEFKKMSWVLACVGFMFLGLCKAFDTHYYDFVLTESNFTRLCETKTILTVNGTLPGPTITVRKGDTAFVNVHNQGSYGVTIHWHGVKQPRNPWYDGPENVTQCPIQAGSNFTYKVIFSTEEGTLWWHAHSDWSRATVYGAIIILPALNTTYPFATPDGEETLVLGSWYKGGVNEIIANALATGGDPNVSDAFTINGEPGHLYKCSNATTYRWVVDYGKTYLLRLINAVLNEEMFFAIANHNLTVVAQDAAYIKPITTSYLMITPGQTMDILVVANQSPSHYDVASTPFVDGDVAYNNSTTTAILQYNGSTTPSTIPTPILPDFDDGTAASNFTTQVRALASKDYPINVPLNITHTLFISVSVNERICANSSCDGPDGNALAASLSNISFVTPSIDILQAYYGAIYGVYSANFPHRPFIFNFTGHVRNDTIYPNFGTMVRTIKYGEEVEIIYQGTNMIAAENHPMHLHGFSFYLVGTGSGNFDPNQAPKTYNLVDPPEVNTIGVPKNGWATVRFKADNPGVWFMHCHLERHASWGMATVLIVTNGNTTETSMLPAPAYMPPCK
ncbi:PREDICTED: putative laccase-9 [Prunus mume]|uniref:Laccase n=1 Tax=Prunus mume TaxID=102107 RepID=A0ABM0PVB8_PRUMU|nr:PREDICTED: putative laccase-9 [Prunus mume]